MNEFLTFGVDLGGTKVKAALVNSKGQILSTHKYPTNPDKGAEKIISDISICLDRCVDKAGEEAKALGIGVAAQLDFQGIVRYSPNLKWRDVPLKKKLEEKLAIPVVVINDGNAAAWGEWKYGSGRNVDDLVVVFVGTGIGGGVISGRRMVVGCNNTAVELGHITIVTDGRKCHCPNYGCLEAYAGGWAIAERAQEIVRDNLGAGKRLISLAGGIDRITSATISQAYMSGDKLARRLVEETGSFLASGAVSIVNMFNPCLLVLGGGVIEGIPDLVSMVKHGVKERALETATEDLKIIMAKLGGDAGVIGAAAYARAQIEKT